jgi:CheY-like chemotaxis protein
MDHMMPGMDGIEATTIIREKIGTDYAKNIPIIALTANAIVGTDKMFLANGFQDFLSKPIDILKMDETINTWVRNKEKEKELGLVPDLFEDSEEPEGAMAKIAMLKGAGLEGLDVEGGLARFAGDVDSYISTLHSYARNTVPLIDAVRDFTEEELSQIAVTVHGIKGSSYSIGANTIGSQAERLEHAAKAGDFDYVSRKIGSFITAAEEFLANLDELLAQIQAMADADRAALEAPDSNLLDDLAQACMTYQMDEIDQLLAELKSYRYESGTELVEWIEKELVQGEFSAVADRLASVC